MCAFCGEDVVVPVWWEPEDDARWRMLLRCGACETYRELIVSNEAAEAFERDLEHGAASIRAALDDPTSGPVTRARPS
jgi:hypothetical protein